MRTSSTPIRNLERRWSIKWDPRRRFRWRRDSKAHFATRMSRCILWGHGTFLYPYPVVRLILYRDTVSLIGVMRGQHMLPGAIDGMKHVCYFRHALALDERRVKFLPEYAYGGSAEAPQHDFDSANNNNIVDRPNWPTLSFYDLLIVTNLLHLVGLNFLVKFITFLFKEYRCIPSNTPPLDTASKREPALSGPSELPIIPSSDSKETRPHTLEVWFAGTHSDM